MANKIIMDSLHLDDFLTKQDHEYIYEMETLFDNVMKDFDTFHKADSTNSTESQENIIKAYDKMGHRMQALCKTLPSIKVYSFETEHENQAEASRVMAKLRKAETKYNEFIYYTQRSYEMLFKLAYTGTRSDQKTYMMVKTPVNNPVQNFAVHKISDIDHKIENTVMCVMLRGALLPSMILSKEIEEYSSNAYATPFALFKIQRDDEKTEDTMQYILDLEHSYFNPDDLHGKDLIFADPMNATGGSLITIINYLEKIGVKPKSISCFHIVSALKGALRVARTVKNCSVYTLWMDPVLNDAAYIMPGLGDAGDRINGCDSQEHPRDILQLLADYGSNIAGLYRTQLRQIEKTVLCSRYR